MKIHNHVVAIIALLEVVPSFDGTDIVADSEDAAGSGAAKKVLLCHDNIYNARLAGGQTS